MIARGLLCLPVVLLLMGAAAGSEVAATFDVAVPTNAAPVLVLEGVEVPVTEGVTISAHALGRELGTAALVGSASATKGLRNLARELVIPLRPEVLRELVSRRRVKITIEIESVDHRVVPVKIARVYFRNGTTRPR